MSEDPVPVERWGIRSWVSIDALNDAAFDLKGLFGQKVKDSALAAGYLPIGEADVQVFPPNPMDPAPEAWEDLPLDRWPHVVAASVLVVSPQPKPSSTESGTD
jgi:hypothetical protein